MHAASVRTHTHGLRKGVLTPGLRPARGEHSTSETSNYDVLEFFTNLCILFFDFSKKNMRCLSYKIDR